MHEQGQASTPGWLKRIEAFGLVKGGLVVWLLGTAGLSLNLRFHLLALLCFVAAVVLVAHTLWRLSRRDAGAGQDLPGTAQAGQPRGEPRK
jgi:hypothetical protein